MHPFDFLPQDFEKEKQKMTELYKIQEQKISLDIGGNKFSTSLQTLRTDSGSVFGAMFSGRHPIRKQEDGSIFIDRDGTHFRLILNYLRGSINSLDQLPDDKLSLSDLLSEASYYQLEGLKQILEPKRKRIRKVIPQKEIYDSLEKVSGGYHCTVRELSYKNSKLDKLRFASVRFMHSLDLSDSSLVETTFYNYYFYDNIQCSFDRTDLRNCRFEYCFGDLKHDFKSLIRKKKITFYDAKNIHLAKFMDEDIRQAIRETYGI